MKTILAFVVFVAAVLAVSGVDGGIINNGKISLKSLLFKQFNGVGSIVPTDGPLPKAVVLNHIEQQVDNFDPINNDRFQQRYLMNGEFFQPGGPVFVFLSGEWPISESRLENSLMVDLARDLNGYMFYLEHRYYGQSFPTPNVTDANLRFLSPEQALADTAHFINHIKSTHVTPGTENSPVVVIGSHYSANLAAWFRQLYPHLAVASWASSAPVLSVINHSDYKVLAGAAYRDVGGEDCHDAIEDGFAEMEAMVSENRTSELYQIFRLCVPLEDDLDVSTFFAIMAEFYSILPQFTQLISLENVCEIITEGEAPSAAHRVARILEEYMEEDCIPSSYEDAIEFDRETGLNDPAVYYGIRQASYQTCTQFGWHHTSDGEDQPFGNRFPIEFYDQACEDVFGDLADNVEANSARINLLYGGLTPNTTYVIYTQGSIDPWRSIGIQEDVHYYSPAFVIEGASQSNDLYSINEEQDSEALIEVKNRIFDQLKLWILLNTEGEVPIPYEV